VGGRGRDRGRRGVERECVSVRVLYIWNTHHCNNISIISHMKKNNMVSEQDWA
jgi:hypothetical protein